MNDARFRELTQVLVFASVCCAFAAALMLLFVSQAHAIAYNPGTAGWGSKALTARFVSSTETTRNASNRASWTVPPEARSKGTLNSPPQWLPGNHVAAYVEPSTTGNGTAGKRFWDDPFVGHSYGYSFATGGANDADEGWAIAPMRFTVTVQSKPAYAALLPDFTGAISHIGPGAMRVPQWRYMGGNVIDMNKPNSEAVKVQNSAHLQLVSGGGVYIWVDELWRANTTAGGYDMKRRVCWYAQAGSGSPIETLHETDWVRAEDASVSVPGRLVVNFRDGVGGSVQLSPYMAFGSSPPVPAAWVNDPATVNGSFFNNAHSFTSSETAGEWWESGTYPSDDATDSPTPDPSSPPTDTVDTPDWVPDGAQDWINRLKDVVTSALDRSLGPLRDLFFFLGGGFGYEQ